MTFLGSILFLITMFLMEPNQNQEKQALEAPPRNTLPGLDNTGFEAESSRL